MGTTRLQDGESGYHKLGVVATTGSVFLIVGISLVTCMITHLFISLSPSACYTWITTVGEDYIHVPQGNGEPQGGMSSTSKK